MGLLNRKTLLQKEKLDVRKIDLGEDEYVFVRQMTGRERDNFEHSLAKTVEDKNGKIEVERTMGDFRAKLAVNCVCDDKGNAIFQPDDYSILSKNMSAKKLMKIADEASKLNGITEEDKEEMVKNSSADQGDSSDSNSAKN